MSGVAELRTPENVWQAKGCKSCVFASVANAGVGGEIFASVATKGLKLLACEDAEITILSGYNY